MIHYFTGNDTWFRHGLTLSCWDKSKEIFLRAKSSAHSCPITKNFKDLHVNLRVTLNGINSTQTEWPLILVLSNCEIRTVMLLASWISAVSVFECRIKSDLALYCSRSANRIHGIHILQARSCITCLCVCVFELLYFTLSLPALKCLRVHCHYYHGNCHFCETCSCLLFKHHCWLTMCLCVCVCVVVCISVKEFCVGLLLPTSIFAFQISVSLAFNFSFCADVCGVLHDVLWFGNK